MRESGSMVIGSNPEAWESAVVLANGHYRTSFAKTAHGLVRALQAGSSPSSTPTGDGRRRAAGPTPRIPVVESVQGRRVAAGRPEVCVVGVVTSGGSCPWSYAPTG
jgi:hypothetical protein